MDANNAERVATGYDKLLDPKTLRANLLLASLYLCAYELLVNEIVDRIRSFLSRGWENGRLVVSEDYKEVTRLHSDVFQASCLWLQQMGAITEEDIADIKAIKRHRHEIAHELPSILSSVDRDISFDHLIRMYELLRKVGTWWARAVDLPCNEEFDGVEVSDEDLIPGPVVMLGQIVKIALELG